MIAMKPYNFTVFKGYNLSMWIIARQDMRGKRIDVEYASRFNYLWGMAGILQRHKIIDN